MGKQQTAVEFYRINLMALVSTGKSDFKTEPEIFNQAKELERLQIENAWDEGNRKYTGCGDSEHYYDYIFNNQN